MIGKEDDGASQVALVVKNCLPMQETLEILSALGDQVWHSSGISVQPSIDISALIKVKAAIIEEIDF